MHFELVIGQGLDAELHRLQAVVVGLVPAVRRLQRLGPVALGRLQVLSSQEQTFIPVHRKISHCRLVPPAEGSGTENRQ